MITLEMAEYLITQADRKNGRKQFAVYREWRASGRMTSRQLAPILGLSYKTIERHLDAAMKPLNEYLMAQGETHEAADNRTEHTEECRELSLITVAQGHEARSVLDNTLRKTLLRSA